LILLERDDFAPPKL
jgi:hypothetical protein